MPFDRFGLPCKRPIAHLKSNFFSLFLWESLEQITSKKLRLDLQVDAAAIPISQHISFEQWGRSPRHLVCLFDFTAPWRNRTSANRFHRPTIKGATLLL